MFAEIDVDRRPDRRHGQRRRQPGRPLQRGTRLRPGAVPRRRHPAQRPRRRERGGPNSDAAPASSAPPFSWPAPSLSAWSVVVIGIHRGDHGKRLTGRPDGLSEAFARRLLAGSRGCDPRDDAEDGPMSRITDLSAAVVVPAARHCDELGCRKCRARSRWLRRKAWRSRKSPNRSARDRKR